MALKRVRRVLLTVLLFGSAACAQNAYYSPSTEPFGFDFASDAGFDDYLESTAAYLSEQRDFIKPGRKVEELALVMPFELARPDRCEGPVRGILLVHGILDTAFAVRDIGEALNAHCYLVRAVLLPGHATRPGDLLNVGSEEWLDAVRFGLAGLKRDADEVFVGGFSLGGLLAAHAVLDDAEVRAAVMFAPALRVTYQVLADQSAWLKHLKEWLDQSPAPLPVRYQAMPTNAVAQVIALIDSYDRKISEGLSTPAFVVVSVDDIAVQGENVIAEFFEHFDNPMSRLDIYGDIEVEEDDRVLRLDSFLPDDKVLNVAHVAIPFRVDNFYFGRNGIHRDCGQYLLIIPTDEVAACQRSDDNWRGELDSTDDESYLPLQRLTYNPFFDETMERVLSFLDSVSGDTKEIP